MESFIQQCPKVDSKDRRRSAMNTTRAATICDFTNGKVITPKADTSRTRVFTRPSSSPGGAFPDAVGPLETY